MNDKIDLTVLDNIQARIERKDAQYSSLCDLVNSRATELCDGDWCDTCPLNLSKDLEKVQKRLDVVNLIEKHE